MMNGKGYLVLCVLLVFAAMLGACAPVIATPAKAVNGSPTYEESLSPANGAVIGDRRPTISWTVYPNGRSIDSFQMMLDGREVIAARTARGAGINFSYRPQADLAAGSHAATVNIAFDGYQPLTLSSSFTIHGNPVDPFAGKNVQQLKAMEKEAISRLNEIRSAMGLPQLSVSRSLASAAQSHSNFLQLNHLIGHFQNKNYPGFTGDTPQDRAGFFGYAGSAAEGIDYGTASPRMSIEGLLDAPYHRLGLINPNDREAGAGFSLQPYNMVINTGSPGARDDDRLMLYPYPGQTGVKTAWFVAESPNPLASYRQDRIYVGYPVSLSFHDAKTRELHIAAAWFTDSAGAAVPHYIVDAGRESELKKHVFLIPHKPLKPGTTYQVKFEGRRVLADGSSLPVAAAWSFTTGSALAIDYLGFVNLEGVDNLELKLKTGDIHDLSYLLIQNGQFVRKYDVAHGFSWTNAAPLSPGKYRLQVTAPSISADLAEYIIAIQAEAGVKKASVSGEPSLRPIPALRAGLMQLGGREYIELFWDKKPSDFSYVLKRGGEVMRSYSNGRYYAQKGLMLPDGDYLLEASRGPAAEEFVLSIYTDKGERRISLTPVR